MFETHARQARMEGEGGWDSIWRLGPVHSASDEPVKSCRRSSSPVGRWSEVAISASVTSCVPSAAPFPSAAARRRLTAARRSRSLGRTAASVYLQGCDCCDCCGRAAARRRRRGRGASLRSREEEDARCLLVRLVVGTASLSSHRGGLRPRTQRTPRHRRLKSEGGIRSRPNRRAAVAHQAVRRRGGEEVPTLGRPLTVNPLSECVRNEEMGRRHAVDGLARRPASRIGKTRCARRRPRQPWRAARVEKSSSRCSTTIR